jgi:hypothetical protein
MRPYKRKPGDFEIRLLRDGRVVFIGPDQALIEIAQGLDGSAADTESERTDHGPQSAPADASSE